MYDVQIIRDSLSPQEKRLTTFQLSYPRFVHAELMTHRLFSRNASSSRAIPVKRMIEMVRQDPAMPIHFGKNKPGMQAEEEVDDIALKIASNVWKSAAEEACHKAEQLRRLGVHKQVVNRILEPFQWIKVVVTSSEPGLANWWWLRDHPDAQPEIQKLARMMREEYDANEPQMIYPGQWHLPYIDEDDECAARGHCADEETALEIMRKMSAARCARVSYMKHDGQKPTIEDDLKLYDRLAGSQPIHASPLEHIATPDSLTNPGPFFNGQWAHPLHHGNFEGWRQWRKMIPGEACRIIPKLSN